MRRKGPAIVLVSIPGIPLLIALATVIVFAPSLGNGFVHWDDQFNFLRNLHYRGLGWEQLRWMFSAVLIGHWTPLTWMTLGLDYLLWGMNPVGYHLTSILFHAANAAVFYFVALRLLGLAMRGLGEGTGRLGAGIAALFFALHPLRAESVAWVTERREVVAGLFFLLTILLYLRACEAEGGSRLRWLAASVGCYALALTSDAIVMTLPVVLIVLDIYPLRRLGGWWRDWIAPQARSVWKEKVPYVLLALAGAVMSVYAVRAVMPLTQFEVNPLSARVAMASYSLWFYFWKTLVPFGLSPLYEVPARVQLTDLPFLGSAIGVGLLTGGFWLLRRRWPTGLAVWAAYGVMVAPVSGLIVHAGPQLVADRYSYFSCLGWALIIAAGVCVGIRAGVLGVLRPSVVRLTVAAVAVWITGLAALTVSQVQVWRDTETLWRVALEVNPACARCHAELGIFLGNRDIMGPAFEHLERALALRPDQARYHRNLGLALVKIGRPEEAIEHFRLVLDRYPDNVKINVEVRNYLGKTLMQLRELHGAIEQLQQVIRLDPVHVDALTNLGIALVALDRPAEAVPYLRRAIALIPEAPLPRFGLACASLAVGDSAAARDQSRILRPLDPRLADWLEAGARPSCFGELRQSRDTRLRSQTLGGG